VDELLPLFPLDLVLLPGELLPLHIFEPRYKEMMRECLESKSEFGVVRAQKKVLNQVGCTAEIVQVIKTYEDGRMDILTTGRRRFALRELDREKAFYRAQVTFLDDLHGSAVPLSTQERAWSLHTELLLLTGEESELSPNREEENLSYRLAAELPPDLDLKQNLLEIRTEEERMNALVEYYEAMIPRLKTSISVRKRAGGNGHVH
jgi:Lon protease-like protein